MTTIDPLVSLPLATKTTPGAVIVGDGLEVQDGVVSASSQGPTIDLSGAQVTYLGMSGKVSEFEITGVSIPATVDGMTPGCLTFCSGDVSKGETIISEAGGVAALSGKLPVEPSDVIEYGLMLTGSITSVRLVVSTATTLSSEGTALCDSILVTVSQGGGEPELLIVPMMEAVA